MEQFVIRTQGGPEPGLYFSDDSVTSWPLPEMLVAPGGHYQKTRESQMPALDDNTAQHLVRGAEYQWVPDQDGVVHIDLSTQDETVTHTGHIEGPQDEDDWVVGQET
jgi:hypothetical protein